eukprot:6215186-Karenia_brevis.AAC.1
MEVISNQAHSTPAHPRSAAPTQCGSLRISMRRVNTPKAGVHKLSFRYRAEAGPFINCGIRVA